MGRGIEINIASNTRDFVRGTTDAAQALDSVSDSLDDLARDADRSGDRLGDSLQDGARDGGRSVERLERNFRDLSDTARRETRQAGDAMARETRDGAERGGRAVRELGDEAKQNASETFSSFDGSIDGLLDGIQGTFGGVMSNLGPLGMAAGAAAAIGIGLISNAVQAGADYTEAMKERVSELTQEFIDTGVEAGPSLDYVIDRLQSLATETEDASTSLKDIRDAADRSGSSFKDLAQAYSGNADDLDKLVESNKEHLQALQDEADAVDTTTSKGSKRYSQLMDQIAGQEQYNGYLAESKKVADEAAEAEANYAAAGGPEMEAKKARIEALNEAYDDIVGSVDEFINKETGVFDVGAYIAAMQARTDALANYQSSLATSGLTDEAKAFLDSQGQEAAATLLAGYTAGTADQKAVLNDLWSEAGSESSGSFNSTFTESMPDEVDGPTVKVDADTTEAESKTGETEKKPREATVKVKADTKQAEADLAAVASKGRTSTITAAASTYAAGVALDNLVRNRTAEIVVNIRDRNGKLIEW